MKDRKKTILIIVISILFVVIAILGVSYAFFRMTLTSGDQVVKIGTLDLVLNESSEAITLSSVMGVSDSEGMSATPSTFEITNNGNKDVVYMVYLDDLDIDSADTRIDDKYLKYNIVKNDVASGALKLTSTGTNPGRVISNGVIAAGDTDTYSLNLWITDEVDGDYGGHVFNAKIRVEVKQKPSSDIDTIIAVNGGVKETKTEMFLYTNEGFRGTFVNDYVTDGVYTMDDEDGTSYYFRGRVNNLVQFGSYESDYYVYRYDDYEYQTLEQCQLNHSSCSVSNKTLKYAAGTSMYFRIVRVNGDGTLRLLYSGTSNTVTSDLGIGNSKYNTDVTSLEQVGYTYNNGVDSTIKKEVDTWYTNALGSSSFDKYIVFGKFCNDASGYYTDYNGGKFAAYTRIFSGTPTLLCSATTGTYGGSYTLKAGLMTGDEVVLAGEKSFATNANNYLDGPKLYWTMTPAFFNNYETVDVWLSSPDIFSHDVITRCKDVQVRPVINVSLDNLNVTGSGTVSDPFVLSAK